MKLFCKEDILALSTDSTHWYMNLTNASRLVHSNYYKGCQGLKILVSTLKGYKSRNPVN